MVSAAEVDNCGGAWVLVAEGTLVLGFGGLVEREAEIRRFRKFVEKGRVEERE